jgi:hypothetical protein
VFPKSGVAGSGREGEEEADDTTTSTFVCGNEISSFTVEGGVCVRAEVFVEDCIRCLLVLDTADMLEVLVATAESERFLQSKHLHWVEHVSPDWKHSQYFFKHPLFLQ